MSGERFLRPAAHLGQRDDAFAAAMRRAERAANPSQPDPRDPIGRTRAGLVVRRNGEHFIPGPFLNTSDLPIVG